MRYLMLFATTLAFVSPAYAGSSSTDARGDGGKSVTQTSSRGTKCTVFNAQGQIMCTRTFGETNHKAAIAKCVKMKC